MGFYIRVEVNLVLLIFIRDKNVKLYWKGRSQMEKLAMTSFSKITLEDFFLEKLTQKVRFANTLF